MKLLLLSFILSFALAMALPSPEATAPPVNCIRMTPEKDKQIDIIVEKLGSFLYNLTIEHEHFDIRLIKLSIEPHTEDEVEEKETVLQLSVNDCQLSDDELEEIDHHREKAKQHEKEREAKAERIKQDQRKEENDKAAAHEHESSIPKGKQEHNQNSDSHEETKEETLKNDQGLSNRDNIDVPAEKEGQHLSNEREIEENHDSSEVNDKTEEILNKKHDTQETDVSLETVDQNEADNLKNKDDEKESDKNFDVMYLDLDEKGQNFLEAMGKKKKNPILVYVQERNSGQTEHWFLKRR